jgi:cephalosporin-C deacetylase-like acetyl esterase
MKNGYQHMLVDHYVHKLRALRAQRSRELAALSSREDAVAYQEKLRKAIAASFGPWPEQTPLDTRVTGGTSHDGYRIENIIFNSRPDFWVTANLYLPDGLTAPAPGVIGCCGHSKEGKASGIYQAFALRLVRNGFVVLMVDPIHQGERDQYPLLSRLGSGKQLCDAHNVMGRQLELIGEFFGSWRVWDGRRAIDVLAARPEVDPKRLAITGNSGGGTLTEWIWANDERLSMAAPSCHVTSFMTNLENELPTDCEQCPPGIIGAGLEMVDLMIVRAPKPAILLGQRYDFFERRGLQEAYGELKRFYELLDAGDQVELFIGPSTHGYSAHNQEAMLSFFHKHAAMPGEPVEITPEPQPKEALNCCPDGNVVKAGSRPIYELIAERAEAWAGCRQLPKNTAEWRDAISKLLRFPKSEGTPHYRVLRSQRVDGQVWQRSAIETEDNVQAIMRKRLEHQGRGDTLDVEEEDVHLYLPHLSSELDSQQCPFLAELNAGGDLYALDVRGLGESMPEDHLLMYRSYGMDYMMHATALMFGESMFGRRVFDLVRCLDLLQAEGAKRIHLYGRGQGALLAAFAAMLRDEVVELRLYNAPESFMQWIKGGVSDWPAASTPRNVLRYFDLPDLYAALAERLTMIDPWDERMGDV